MVARMCALPLQKNQKLNVRRCRVFLERKKSEKKEQKKCTGAKLIKLGLSKNFINDV